MKIIVDAMSGDNAPEEIIKGAVRARDELDVDMVTKAYQRGREDCLKAIADYSGQEMKSMGEITKFINNSLE